MRAIDWAILGAIALAVGLAIFATARSRKRGKRCCGDCSGCTGCEKKQ